MKTKSFLTMMVLMLSVSTLFAQQNQSNKDKWKADFETFKAKRVAYITEQMGLNTEEAQAFWPLCNELQEKKFELNKELRQAVREMMKAEKEGKATEADFKKVVDLSADTKLKEAQLEKDYYAKFLKVVSPEKVLKYQRAEQHFARQFVEGRNDKDRGPRDGNRPAAQKQKK